jgi:hypothetical protein
MTQSALMNNHLGTGDKLQVVVLHGMETHTRIGMLKDYNRDYITLEPFTRGPKDTFSPITNEVIEPLDLVIEIIILQRKALYESKEQPEIIATGNNSGHTPNS